MTASILHSTGNNEWYTPIEYIHLVRKVLGKINLDPASCDYAQEWISAEKYYTINQNGLAQKWTGKIWLNPPYSETSQWVAKLINEYDKGNVIEAIILVKPSVSTTWYYYLSERYYQCQTKKRIHFISLNPEFVSRPAHGNTFFYLGNNLNKFQEVFSEVGVILMPANYLVIK